MEYEHKFFKSVLIEYFQLDMSDQIQAITSTLHSHK